MPLMCQESCVLQERSEVRLLPRVHECRSLHSLQGLELRGCTIRFRAPGRLGFECKLTGLTQSEEAVTVLRARSAVITLAIVGLVSFAAI